MLSHDIESFRAWLEDELLYADVIVCYIIDDIVISILSIDSFAAIKGRQ